MKLISCFKDFLILKQNITFFNKKILKFKKKKWIKLVKLLTKNLKKKRKKFLINNFVTHLNFKKWNRLEQTYRLSLLEKKIVFEIFGNSVKFKNFKKLFFAKKSIKNISLFFKFVFLKLEYRLDIFLYKTNFFKSIHEVRSNIQKGLILVNSVSIFNYNYQIQRGDIISVQSLFDIKKKLSFLYYNLRLLSNVEYDFYNNKFIFLKKFFEISDKDFFNFNYKKINLQKLLYYCNRN